MKKAEEANAYYNKQPAKMNTYEASEGVKDMPIKQTEESHKKCSPGEFGMHKEGAFAFGQKLANDMLKGVQDFGKTYMHYTQSNPVWNAGRAAVRSVDAFTDPKNHMQPFQAASNAALGKPAPTPSPAPVDGDYTKSNPVWNGLRSAGRAIDTFTDPREALSPGSFGKNIFNKLQ